MSEESRHGRHYENSPDRLQPDPILKRKAWPQLFDASTGTKTQGKHAASCAALQDEQGMGFVVGKKSKKDHFVVNNPARNVFISPDP